MKTVEEIQNEIQQLPQPEYLKLWHWFSAQEWGRWDNELEQDIQSGRLNFLIEEAIQEKSQHQLGDL